MEYSVIKYEVSDRILTITLNRPDNLNAWNRVMMAELIDAVDRADEDDDIRAVIVTGAGRAFCAGADLGSRPEEFNLRERVAGESLETFRDTAGQFTLRVYDLKKPVIAAINGPAVGAGITMTLPMDIRLASENARFGFAFSRRGMSSEGCSNWFLPRLVGTGKAAEWILTGRVFPVQEALRYGLVNEVVAPEALMPRAREIAAEIAQNTSAMSISLCRQLLWKTMVADPSYGSP